jgi:type IV pilus biogenesis protein CpaD/CtpE
VSSSFRRTVFAAASVLVLALAMALTGCADDPILGPDVPTDDGGGSYGVIKQFAPGDTISAPENPEQF